MAGIDKTYTDSYTDYREFKEWADKQTVTFFNGYKVRIGDWVWEYEKGHFSGSEIPIMNTPSWLDVYLIQNCQADFVLDRLKSVYNADIYHEMGNVDLTAKPSGDFRQNREIRIVSADRTEIHLHKRPIDGSMWWLQSDSDFSYHDKSNTWSSYCQYYPRNTNTARIATVNGIIAHLKRQYLPEGGYV